ncbi:MAG: hypothetical protein AB7D36_02820 [Oscillospiraceae bacterium]
MNDFDSIQKMLQKTGKTSELMGFMSSEEGKRVEKLVDKSALEQAMQKGDIKSMERMLRQVLSTGEGKALADKISEIMTK